MYPLFRETPLYEDIPVETLAARRHADPESLEEQAVFQRLLLPLTEHGPVALAERDAALAAFWSALPDAGPFDWLCEVNDLVSARIGPPIEIGAWLSAPALHSMTQSGWLNWSFSASSAADLERHPFPITDVWLRSVAATHQPNGIIPYIKALRDESRTRGYHFGLRAAKAYGEYAFSRGIVRVSHPSLSWLLDPGQPEISAHERVQAGALVSAAGSIDLEEMTLMEAIEAIEVAHSGSPAAPETFRRIVRALAIQILHGRVRAPDQVHFDLELRFPGQGQT